MSRVAKEPVILPRGVDVTVIDDCVTVKGPKGELFLKLNRQVGLTTSDENDYKIVLVSVSSSEKKVDAIAGTTRALLNNMAIGVSQGFQRRLELIGVGNRAEVKNDRINLSLGYSHPISYQLPDGVTAETPSNTVILLSSIDKQLLGKVGAEIKAYRRPEPYKGKGIKYANEKIKRKETKKK